jgi:hypothetical protein
LLERTHEQLHEKRHFLLGTTPVFGTEGKEGQILDTALKAGLTESRTVSTPRLWPATRGRKRFLAQRPLPSMMMAMCRGTSVASGRMSRRTGKSCHRARSRKTAQTCHQLGLFLGEHLVDFGDVLVGQLLDIILRTTLVVLGDFTPCSSRILELRIGIATQIAHGNLGILAFVLDHLDQVAAALFGQAPASARESVHPVRRIQAQIAIANGFFNLGCHVLFPWLHADGAGIDQVMLAT